ncbi:MAG TPA: TIGR04282 family arsenosugar biosynthesis glycosyltransferase [Thermomicrobiales bacterium]|nr:TIGR04282 family arsenosugar biosynthesis glycosyltransferase [Thermomicrobiales bacterium]
MSRSNRLLMIAARAPIPGETKTRLGRAIGMEQAARLYRAFLVDLAARFTGDGEYDVAWTHSPPEADFAAIHADLCGGVRPGALFVPQEGPDWGTRQANLLRWGVDHGYAHTILIASDSPHLGGETIDAAFAVLERADVAIGRVQDGGYYLIGLNRFADILSGVAMSTSSAADGVVLRAGQLGLRVAEVPATFDIDEASDLSLLVAALAPGGDAAPATWRTLAALGLRDGERVVIPETTS